MGRILKNARFSQKELLLLLITAIIGGILLAWRKWGESSVDINAGIENTIIGAVAVLLALLVNFGVQKIYASRKGYETTYQLNYYGLGIGLLFGVISNGVLTLIIPGWVTFKSKNIQRIGKWRYRPYLKEYGYTINWGIFANLLFATFASTMNNPIFNALFIANLLIAIYSLIPAPFNSGFHVFFSSLYQYGFMLCFTLVYSALLYSNYLFGYLNFWIILINSFFMGVLGLYFVFYKSN